MRAISWDKTYVPLMGIPVNLIISITFAIGAGLAGAAGTMYGLAYPVIDPYMGILVGWKAFIAAVVGGIGNVRGAMIGAFILGGVEIMVVALLPSTYRDLVVFSLLLALIILRAARHSWSAQGAEDLIRVLQDHWRQLADQPWLMPPLLGVGLALACAIPQFHLFNNYVQLLLMYIGINIILATSLNLVNGYMGEFSLAHAGFMAVGAYTSALLTMHVLPPDMHGCAVSARRPGGRWRHVIDGTAGRAFRHSRCGAITWRSSPSPS